MDFALSKELEMLRKAVREFAEKKIAPNADEWDADHHFPIKEIMKPMGELGFFGTVIPEEYDGLGGGCFELCLVVEEISRACSGVSVTYAATALGAYSLLDYGNEQQKQKYLPDIASGQRLAAFALTESTAGSDASAIRTTAVRDKDGYILNGTKQFITNGGEAEIYTTIALTDPKKGARGASAFIVEKDTPGFSFGKKEQKMGIRYYSLP